MSSGAAPAQALGWGRRAHPAAVVSAVAAAVLLALGTLTLAIVNRASIHGIDQANALEIVMPLMFALVGGVVGLRRPEHPVGWLFLFMAVVIGVGGFAGQYGRLGTITTPGSLPATVFALWLYNWFEQLVYPAGAATLTLALLPDGELPSQRWRPLVPAALIFTVLTVLLAGLSPGPLSGLSGPAQPPVVNNPVGVAALGNLPAWASTLVWMGGTAVLVAAAIAPVVKLRRSSGESREQARWITYVVLLTALLEAAVTIAGAIAPSAPFVGSGAATTTIALFGFGVALPVATLVAILKYRLYEIDVVISRTLVYGSLAVLITGVYVGIAVGIGELVGSGGKPNLGLSILATAIVAIGFQPARERLQRVANRLVYGRRATPYQVLSEFSSSVAGSYAADDVLPRMARVLQEGTGAQEAQVWLLGGAALHAAATWPSAGSAVVALPMDNGTLPDVAEVTRMVEVRHQGDLLGALSVTKRRGESLTPVEEKLLGDLAHQAGLVLKNVGLTADLQRRLEELRASRQRLVSAQDAERRRLERNLHDGAQQHLVALKVKLGLAEMLAVKNPERAKATLQQLKSDTDEALETLRDLARGIYPPLLAEKGLATALESQARKATVPVTVDADGVGRFPQDIEATVYFCVLEALQNVQKYANATRAAVRLRATDGMLCFEVEDDGAGFDGHHAKKGAGLTNMNDRLDAVSGSLTIESSPGHGARVSGVVPTRHPGSTESQGPTVPMAVAP